MCDIYEVDGSNLCICAHISVAVAELRESACGYKQLFRPWSG